MRKLRESYYTTSSEQKKEVKLDTIQINATQTLYNLSINLNGGVIMKYINYEDVKSEDTILLLCGKQNKITHKLTETLREKISPEHSEGREEVENVFHLTLNTTSDQLDEIFSEPPFIGHSYLILGDYSVLEQRVKRKLLRELATPRPHIKAIILISDFKDYFSLANNKKFDVGKSIYLYRIPKDLYKMYARKYTKKDIGDKPLNIYIKRTSTYDNFILYLDKLKSLPSPITSEAVREHVPDCRTYTLDDYLTTLIMRDKKTIHMKALTDCLAKYKGKTYEEVTKVLGLLVEIKRLTLNGFLLPITVKEDLEYMKEKGVLNDDIKKLGNYRIIKYLNLVSSISITELQLIYLSFIATKPNMHNLYILTDIVYNRNETKHLLHSIATGKLKL